MRFSRAASVLIVFIILQSCAFADVRKYHYREQTGAKIITIERIIDIASNNIQLLYNEGPAAESYVNCQPDYNHKNWHYMRVADKTDAYLEKKGCVLTAKGELNGKPFTKEWKLDDTPWYQTLEFALVPWLQGKTNEIQFWIVRPTDMEIHKMVAIREGERAINIEGKQVDTIKVRVTLPGMMSMFWSADYWFRKSDYNFIKYIAVRGGPGTPQTEVFFTEE